MRTVLVLWVAVLAAFGATARTPDAAAVAEADLATQLGHQTLQTGSPREAAKHFSTALSAWQRAGDDFGAWSAQWMLGKAELQADRLPQALEALERALARVEALRSSGSPLSTASLETNMKILGIPSEVLQSAVVPFFAQLRPQLLDMAEASTRGSLSEVLGLVGRLPEARRQLDRAADLSRQLGGAIDYDVLVNRSRLERREWRLDEAARSLRAALASFDHVAGIAGLELLPPQVRYVPTALLVEAELLRGQGEAALQLTDDLAARARRAGDLALELRARRDRAAVLVQLGDFAAALAELASVQNAAETSGNPLLLAETRVQLGGTASLAGHYEEALRHLEPAVRSLAELDRPYLEAPARVVLALAHHQLGDDAGADRALESARRIAMAAQLDEVLPVVEMVTLALRLDWQALSRLRLDRLSSGFAAVLAADLFAREVGPTAEAETRARAALALAEGRGERFAAALARQTVAEILFRQGKKLEAEQEIEASIREVEASGAAEVGALLRALAAVWRLEAGEPQAGLAALTTSAEALERLAERVATDDALALYLGTRQREVPAQLLVERLARDGRWQEAFEAAEKARARALRRLVGQPRPARRDSAEAERLRRELSQVQIQLVGRERAGREDGETAALRTQIDALDRELQRAEISTGPTREVVAASLADVRAALPEETTLVSYYLTPRRAFAWVIDEAHFEGFELAFTDLDAERVAALVTEEGGLRRGSGVPGEPTGDERWRAASETLYQKLIAPLAEHLRYETLLVVPHGVLHRLPFAVLRRPSDGRFLLEDKAIGHLASASLLGVLRSARRAGEVPAVVAANSTPRELPLATIRGVDIEAREVAARLLVEPLLAVKEDALRTAVARRPEILHLAAHGVFLPERPRFSYLALASDDLAGPPERDGRLAMHEILDLDLSSVRITVLSACDTGLGQGTAGDDVIGLVRALHFAGSRTVVASLWAVDDVSTPKLMSEFYRRLQAGKPAVAALRGAQLELLRATDSSALGSWAAFTVNGDPGN